MQNGIIINGVKYEATRADKPHKRCVKCALRLKCFNAGRLCEVFGDIHNPVYFKVKKEDGKSGWPWPGHRREPAEGQGDFRDNCDDEYRNAI